jgi:hypothetical protein
MMLKRGQPRCAASPVIPSGGLLRVSEDLSKRHVIHGRKLQLTLLKATGTR